MQLNFEILQKVVVLYAEDEPELRSATTIGLQKVCHEVLVASNGQEAIELFANNQNRINIVISDIQMPIKNGIELAKEIKQLVPNMPIILATAFSDSDHLFQAIEIKVNTYLKKPIELINLYEIIQKEVIPFFSAIELEHKNNIIKQQLADLEFFKKSVSNYVLISKTDPHGIIEEVNDKFCEVSQYTKEELIGKAHNIIRHPDVPKYFFKKMWDTIQSGNTWHGTVKNKSKNGNDYYADSYIKPIFDDENNISGYLSIRFDITAQEEKSRATEKKLLTQMSSTSDIESKIKQEYLDKIDLIMAENKRLKADLTELNVALELLSTKKDTFVEVEDKKQLMKYETTIVDLEAELSKARNQVRLLTTAKINHERDINHLNDEMDKLKKEKRHLNETLQDVLSSMQQNESAEV